MKNKQVTKAGYGEIVKGMSSEDKDALHHVYCNSTVTITQLAREYRCSIAVMRRIIMEMLGEEGYGQAKLQRARVRNTKSWRKYKYKHSSTTVLYSVLKLLIDTDKTFFEVSKEVGCSRERVGQIASECDRAGIKLNEDRASILKNKNLYGKGKIRGYSSLSAKED